MGDAGGLSPDPANGPPLIIDDFAAAIAPVQFALKTDEVRPVLRAIARNGEPIVGRALSGPFAGRVLFKSIVDIIGGKGRHGKGAQQFLMERFPDILLVELPGADNRGIPDLGIVDIEIIFPAAFPLGCPEGTSRQ